MIYFLFGEDSYRAKQKLDEIVAHYKEVHKSGLNLVYIDAKEKDFKDVLENFKVVSMFAEKKLIILKNVFADKKFQEDLLEGVGVLKDSKDIVVIFEKESPDQRSKLFKKLLKEAKCQEFKFLQGASLKKWVLQEFGKNKSKISYDAEDMFLAFAGNDLWQIENEIKKLSNYRKNETVKREDIALLMRPKIENDIFKTIDALAQKNKNQALHLMHKHLENGDNALYLLSMIAYQFRNLLIIKELMEKRIPYNAVAKQSGLHPFVVKKTSYLCAQFSFEDLKKIYQKIFQVDSDIKTGKIDAEIALDLLVSQI